VTSLLGKPAELICLVQSIGEYTASWYRRRPISGADGSREAVERIHTFRNGSSIFRFINFISFSILFKSNICVQISLNNLGIMTLSNITPCLCYYYTYVLCLRYYFMPLLLLLHVFVTIPYLYNNLIPILSFHVYVIIPCLSVLFHVYLFLLQIGSKWGRGRVHVSCIQRGRCNRAYNIFNC